MYCMITRTVCFKGYCHFLNYNTTSSCVNDKTGCHFTRVAGIVNDTAVTAKWQPSPMLYVCLCFSHLLGEDQSPWNNSWSFIVVGQACVRHEKTMIFAAKRMRLISSLLGFFRACFLLCSPNQTPKKDRLFPKGLEIISSALFENRIYITISLPISCHLF